MAVLSDGATGRKVLVAFDFDHTIVDANTDTVILDLLADKKLPSEVEKQGTLGWTKYMGAVLQHMKTSQVSSEDIRTHLQKTPLVPEIKDVLEYLRQHKDLFECIVISDANSLFIKWILEHTGFVDVFSCTELHTNPAKVDETDTIRVDYYHNNTGCSLSCGPNMCKGRIVDEQMAKRSTQPNERPFRHVIFCGDGSNDFCPSSRLTADDYVLAREGFKLIGKIRRQPEQVRATVIPWKSGAEILQLLKKVEHDCKA